MIWCAPGAGWADIVDHSRMLLHLVGNVQDVGQRRRTASANATGAPGVRLPCHQRAIFLCSYFHAGISGRTTASDLQLGVALQHDFYRLASRLL